jgi:hypothetical protein
MVHRLGDLCDFGETLHREVELPLHHSKDRRELRELIGFRRDQWMFFEERHDLMPRVFESEDPVNEEILSMVIVPSVQIQAATTEVLPDELQCMHASRSLNNSETWLHLPSDLVRRISIDRNAEATFTVDEADDPLLDPWPFLLIARTGRIFTAHVRTVTAATDMNEYRRILGYPSK